MAEVRRPPEAHENRMRSTSLLTAVLFMAALASQSPTPPPPTPAAAPTAVRLVYEMPVDALQRALRDQANGDLEQVLAGTVVDVQTRLGAEAKVARQAATGFTVDLANADAAEVERVRRCVETAGKLEMRVLANGDYSAGDVKFDLATESERLQAWLDAGGRDKLRTDPGALVAFHDDAKAGPLAGKSLRWFVHRIEADAKNAGRWQPSCRSYLRDACVAAYADKDWNDGTIPKHVQALPAEQRFLVELIAVNMHEEHFDSRDLDPQGTRRVRGGDGEPCLQYRLRGDRGAAYADWSEKNIGKVTAILWNDQVLSTPRFVSRISSGIGQIAGSFADEDLETMQRALQAPPLTLEPRFVRQEPAGK